MFALMITTMLPWFRPDRRVLFCQTDGWRDTQTNLMRSSEWPEKSGRGAWKIWKRRPQITRSGSRLRHSHHRATPYGYDALCFWNSGSAPGHQHMIAYHIVNDNMFPFTETDRTHVSLGHQRYNNTISNLPPIGYDLHWPDLCSPRPCLQFTHHRHYGTSNLKLNSDNCTIQLMTHR